MILRSGITNRALGYILMLAGAGYIIDTGAHALLGNYDDHETLFGLIVAIPSVIGELSVGLCSYSEQARNTPAESGPLNSPTEQTRRSRAALRRSHPAGASRLRAAPEDREPAGAGARGDRRLGRIRRRPPA